MFPARPAKRGSGIGERVWTGVDEGGEGWKEVNFFFFFFRKKIYIYVGGNITYVRTCVRKYVRKFVKCTLDFCYLWVNYLFYVYILGQPLFFLFICMVAER